MAKRDSRGRFLPKAKHSSGGSRSRSTAITRRASGPIVVREEVRVTSGGRGRGRGGGGHHRGGREPMKSKGERMIYAALYGYVKAEKPTMLEAIPTPAGVPKSAVIGFVGHLLGKKNRHIDRASAALLDVAAFEFGSAGFKLSGIDD